MRSDGQTWAVEQLTEIAAKSNGALEIVAIREPAAEGSALTATISVRCNGYTREDGGIPLRPREKLLIEIKAAFPLKVPSLYFTHNRYAGFPHVQWGTYICLYQAPETEWQPGQGMWGFVQRMHDWLAAGAANQLEPIGLPMHPPVAYRADKYFVVVPTQNAPVVEPPWWHGFVKVTEETDVAIHLGEWIKVADWDGVRVVPAILLPGDMPFEYPTTVAGLKKVLEERGVPLEIVRLVMAMGAIANPDGKPLVFMLGAAMRGTMGGEKLQHLAAWHVNPDKAKELKDACRAETPDDPVDQAWFVNWSGTAGINWCTVMEDRPEIVVARDQGTSAQYWRGRCVALLGCGAIGSMVAMLLTRAGAAKLQLYDNGHVKPGLLSRQIFDHRQIGFTKVSTTRNNVRYINPKIEIVEESSSDILAILQDDAARAKLLSADIVINGTASRRVATALEFHLRAWPKAHPPIASMAVGHRADTAVMTLAHAVVPGIAHDLDRRLKISFANSPSGRPFLDEFWPTHAVSDRLFQPEPGCSDPTFVGSAADMAILSARMLNVLGEWLDEGDDLHAKGFGMRVTQTPNVTAEIPSEAEFRWPADEVSNDLRRGYQIRLSQAAKAQMLTWMKKSERVRGKDVETGGVLFGQIDDFLKVIWITAASGPPSDSKASKADFICGTRGVAAMAAELDARCRGSASFIGMWHTHPGSVPMPSPTDRGAMVKLLGSPEFGGRQFLMLIVGGYATSPVIAGSLFKRDE